MVSPQDFIEKWKPVTTTERATAQSHFNDLCDLLGEPKPHDVDPTGESFAFEKGASKAGGGEGWADVWKKGCFAWEYKGKHKDLEKALAQVKQYAAALENPPLLVASDIERIVVITNWTNTVSARYEFQLDDLTNPKKLEQLRQVFRGDEKLRPDQLRSELTAKVAKEFAELAEDLQKEGYEPLRVAHFVNRLVFCMFAEDAGLLPNQLFTQLLEKTRGRAQDFEPMAKSLFGAMKSGGFLGFEKVEWFNGGLFDDDDALPLRPSQIERVLNAAKQDWSSIDPSILGTLFERGLDPAKRSQLGAHYTDPENIMRIVNPVILEPLSREWDTVKAEIEKAKTSTAGEKIFERFLYRLRGVTVLDPACGSGNFLYLALRGLKDLEHRVLLEGEQLGMQKQFRLIDPQVLKGIELNVYAAELARVSIWIGELQWQIEHGFEITRNPILKSLNAIENRDALLNADGTEAEWPEAEFIIGNPPFIGDKKMRGELGDEYVDDVRKKYEGRVPGSADFVCYWFSKIGVALESGTCKFSGLVSTNKIRKGSNNQVLRTICEHSEIFSAWSDQPWHDERGAAVRVAITCIAKPNFLGSQPFSLDGEPVEVITPGLSPSTKKQGNDSGTAVHLTETDNLSYNGFCKSGEFDVPEAQALKWLHQPNPHGKPNSDILRPLIGARDLAERWKERWLIDTGVDSSEASIALYAGPARWLEEFVKPERMSNREAVRREKWWQLGRPRPQLRNACKHLSRYLITPETAKHRYFRWLDSAVAPDHRCIVFVTDQW